MSKVDGKFMFSPISVNFLTEVAKVLFAIVMLLFQVRLLLVCFYLFLCVGSFIFLPGVNVNESILDETRKELIRLMNHMSLNSSIVSYCSLWAVLCLRIRNGTNFCAKFQQTNKMILKMMIYIFSFSPYFVLLFPSWSSIFLSKYIFLPRCFYFSTPFLVIVPCGL